MKAWWTLSGHIYKKSWTIWTVFLQHLCI